MGKDKAEDVAPWGSTVTGIFQGKGWVKVGERYLPTWLYGAPVLIHIDRHAADELVIRLLKQNFAGLNKDEGKLYSIVHVSPASIDTDRSKCALSSVQRLVNYDGKLGAETPRPGGKHSDVDASTTGSSRHSGATIDWGEEALEPKIQVEPETQKSRAIFRRLAFAAKSKPKVKDKE